jgi:hypothetical protein
MNSDHDIGSVAVKRIQRTSSHTGQKRGAANWANDTGSAPSGLAGVPSTRAAAASSPPAGLLGDAATPAV